MKITVNRAELVKALAVTAEFVHKSKNFPLLNNISITVAEGGLVIIATDVESASCYHLQGEGQTENGTVILPAQGVRDFTASAIGNTVRFVRHNESHRAVLESDRSRVSFRIAAAEVFPDTPVTSALDAPGLLIKSRTLAGIFSRTSFVNQRIDGMPMGEGTVNPNTSGGVRLVCNEWITALAHDGHRMARCIVGGESKPGFAVTVPPEAARWLSTVRWPVDQAVLLQRTQGGMCLSAGPLAVFFRLTDVRIPDTTMAFQPEFEHRATFKTEEFIRAVSNVARFSDANARGGRSVVLTFQPAEKVTVVGGSDFADSEAVEEIDCTHKAPAKMSFEFDPRYLVEFAKAVPSECFDLRFNQPSQHCRFTHQGDTEFVYVVVPRYRRAK